MRSDAELRELERRRVHEERQELARHAAAERRQQELREEDRRKAAHVQEQAMLALAARYEASVVSLAEQPDEAMNTLPAAPDDPGALNTSPLSKPQHVLALASTTTRSIQADATSTEDSTGSALLISAPVSTNARIGAATLEARAP